MASITTEQATGRMAELVDYMATVDKDSHEYRSAMTMLELWERASGVGMAREGQSGGDHHTLTARHLAPPKVLPPTQAQVAVARKDAPSFGRFEALPPVVEGGEYGQMRPPRAVHLPYPNAFDRAGRCGEPVRVTLEPPVEMGAVRPLGGAIVPVFDGGTPSAPPRQLHASPSPSLGASMAQWQGTPADASIGICIGTHGSVPYVHLALETLRIHNPGVHVLIHDDSSEEQEALRSLAARYGADFVSTESRRMPTVGDMSAFAEALNWGSRLGLDIVIKCSRRFIIDKPFAEGLRELMHNLRYATACAPCAHFSFGFRSELVAMATQPWLRSGALPALNELVRQNQPDGLPEAMYHDLARHVHKYAHPALSGADDDHHPSCDYVVRSEQRYGRRNENGDHSWDAYAWWTLMGLSRVSKVPGVLWHDSHVPADYAALAAHYHLPYDEAAFTVTPGE